MVTFERAQQIVYEAESGNWEPSYNFQVPPYGWETEDHWFVLAIIEPEDPGGVRHYWHDRAGAGLIGKSSALSRSALCLCVVK